MILDTAQLSKTVHNVLEHSFDGQGNLYLHRFSENQRKTYALESEDWIKKTLASASATLDFITDSDYIALKFDLTSASSQKMASVDLYVDGVFYDHRYTEDLSVKLAGFSLPEGEHRVTVYFPWSTQTVINQVQLSDGASVIPVQKKLKMLCVGDSITQGYTSKFTSLSYVNQVARALDAQVVNQGIGGYYFNEAVIDESICDYKPDLITVAYGTNDYSRYETAQEYADHAGRYIKKLAQLFPDAKIVGILPIYRNDQNHRVRTLYRSYSLDDARQILREYYQALPNGYVISETGIARIPQAYVSDFLHPNEFGFCLMARGIAEQLQKILSDK